MRNPCVCPGLHRPGRAVGAIPCDQDHPPPPVQTATRPGEQGRWPGQGYDLDIALLGVLLLGWALRLYRLGGPSFWYDEGASIYAATLPLPEALAWTARELIPPLYHLLLAAWVWLAGLTEFATRFLSVGAGLLLAAGMVRLAKDLHSPVAGLTAALLVALSPFYVWHSRDARMYMLQALLGLLATTVLVRAIRRPHRWRHWAGLALLDTLALYTQATTGFLLALHALSILASGLVGGRRLVALRGGLALVGALALWLPWAVYASPFLGQNAGYWPGRLEGWFVALGAWRGFLTGEVMGGGLEMAALAVWTFACLVGAGALLLAPSRPERKALLFLLCYLGIPVVVMAWLFRGVPKFSPRYLILASPPLFLLPAIGVATLLRGSRVRQGAGGLVLACLVATAGLGLDHLYHDATFAKSDFRTAAHLVRQGMAPDELVLVVPGHTFPVWQYYFGPEGWAALPDDPILNVNHVLHYRNTAQRLNALLADHSGVWLVEWEPWQIDPTDLVGGLLGQVGEEAPVEQPLGLRLRHFRLRAEDLPLPPEPPVPAPLSASLDLPLDLLGCAVPERVAGDGELRVACYWQARDALPHYLSVSARLIDVNGERWGQADTAISGPYLVTGRWPLGQPVLGQYGVRPVPGISPGEFYQVQLLVYEADGTGHGEAVAGQVAIERPSTPFSVTLPFSQVPPSGLGGLVLEAARLAPERLLPGEEVRVEAVWRVVGAFSEPRLALEGSAETIPLLPQPGAMGAWRAGDRYLTISHVPVSRYALGGPTALWAISEDGRLLLGRINVDLIRTFALPAGVECRRYRLGADITLEGFQFAVEGGDAGRVVAVVLYWRASALIERSYTVFVHVVGPDGRIVAQADAPPQSGRHPTTHWWPGEVVADAYRLQLPAGLPSGEYRVVAGLYDLATSERLMVIDSQGEPVSDNAILMGRFEMP